MDWVTDGSICSGRLRVNSPRAACQVIDGEAVLIDFDHGRYFSSLGTGGEIIRLLDLGWSVEQIAAACETRQAGAAQAVQAFVAELQQEQLFVPEADASQPLEGTLELQMAEFTAPELQKYTELEDLLKLDPIHDVDPAGWPLREIDEGA